VTDQERPVPRRSGRRRGRARADLGADSRAMARGAGVNLAGALAATALGFFVTWVITQLALPREIGLVAIAAMVLGLAPTNIGIQTATLRYVARAAGSGDWRAARAHLQVGIVLALVTSVLTAALVWWLAPWITETLLKQPEAMEILRIMTLSVPGIVLSRIVMAGVQGFGVMGYGQLLGIQRRLIELATAAPLLALGFGAEGLAVSGVITAWAAFAISIVFMMRVHRRAFVPVFAAWTFGPTLRFALPQFLNSKVFWAVNRAEAFILARYVSLETVGIYAIAHSLVGPVQHIAHSVTTMFAPRVAAREAMGDMATLGTMLKRVTGWNIAMSLPWFALLIVVPVPLLSIFGGVYEEGAKALAILAVAQLVNTSFGPLGMVMNMTHRQYINLSNNLLAGALNIGLCLFLIPRYGMVGAASSFAISLSLVNVLKAIEVRLIFGIHPFRGVTANVFLAGGLAMAAALPVSLVPDWPNPILAIVAAGGVLFVVYFLALRTFGLSDEERELLALGRARISRRVRRIGLLARS
jgi:O-antigen/teichoic acid export membrane protein